MPLRVYRVCRAIYARLDGRGAHQAGGRWNSPGRAVVYMAQSVALAVLENLVHMPRQDFPSGYVTVAADILDDRKILTLEEVSHVCGLSRTDTQKIGDYWVDNRLSVALRAPSVVVRSEFNYLLNPAHPDFRRIVIAPPVLFHFDARLFK